MNLDSSAFVAAPELLAALEKHSVLIPCPEDRILFVQGESSTGIYILHSGTGRLGMAATDGSPIFEVPVADGTLLGLPGVIGNQPYSLTARADKGSDVRYISRENFSQLMLSEPSLSLQVLRILAAEVRTARAALTQV